MAPARSTGRAHSPSSLAAHTPERSDAPCFYGQWVSPSGTLAPICAPGAVRSGIGCTAGHTRDTGTTQARETGMPHCLVHLDTQPVAGTFKERQTASHATRHTLSGGRVQGEASRIACHTTHTKWRTRSRRGKPHRMPHDTHQVADAFKERPVELGCFLARGEPVCRLKPQP